MTAGRASCVSFLFSDFFKSFTVEKVTRRGLAFCHIQNRCVYVRKGILAKHKKTRVVIKNERALHSSKLLMHISARRINGALCCNFDANLLHLPLKHARRLRSIQAHPGLALLQSHRRRASRDHNARHSGETAVGANARQLLSGTQICADTSRTWLENAGPRDFCKHRRLVQRELMYLRVNAAARPLRTPLPC